MQNIWVLNSHLVIAEIKSTQPSAAVSFKSGLRQFHTLSEYLKLGFPAAKRYTLNAALYLQLIVND